MTTSSVGGNHGPAWAPGSGWRKGFEKPWGKGFEKSQYRPPIALQDRDLELLRTVFDYRLISTPQFLRLFEEESRDGIYRRLQRLFHHGYLDRIGRNPNAPLIYSVARRGAEVLDVTSHRAVCDRYVAHQLMIGDFRIALTHACREGGIELAWRRFPDGQPIRPDGFFTLRFLDRPEGRNRAHFFLEADRSTMVRERFVSKLRAYAAWRAVSAHTSLLGLRNFRIVTVTKSEERLRSLVSATEACAELATTQPMLWFTSRTRYSGDQHSQILEEIWNVAGARGRSQSLLPEANTA